MKEDNSSSDTFDEIVSQALTPEQKRAWDDLWGGAGGILKVLSEQTQEMTSLKENANTEAIGQLLVRHLAIEHIMDQVLPELPKDTPKPNNFGPSFSQKIKLLPRSNMFIEAVFPGIIQLNQIRNEYAHDLQYELTHDDLGAIGEISPEVDEIRKKTFSPLERIFNFCKIAEIFLLLGTPKFESRKTAIYRRFPTFKILTENSFNINDQEELE